MKMSFNFKVEPVDEKPKRINNSRSSSKYEPILTAFLEFDHKLVMVDNTGLDCNYLRQQLVRVMKQNGIISVQASVRNGELYLERK
jgi:hypothetical protein